MSRRLVAVVGRGFLCTLLYGLHGHRGDPNTKGARLIGGNMAGDSARTLSREFGQLRRLRPNLGKAVAHFSLSFSSEEHPLSDSELADIAAEFMADMEFKNAPYVVIRHEDTDHPHIHIIASRVTTDGKTVSDAMTYRRAEAVARRLELNRGLIPFKPKEKKMPTTAPQESINDISIVDEGSLVEPFCEGVSADNLTPRKTRELRRQAVRSEDYRHRLIALLGVYFHSIKVMDWGLVIHTKDGGRLIDKGDSVRAYRMSDEDAAKRIVMVGKAKSWTAMRFTGSPAFLKLAFLEAIAQGVIVVPRDEEQARILQAVTDEAKRQVEAIREGVEETATKAVEAINVAANTFTPAASEKSLEEEAKESAAVLRQMHVERLKQGRLVPPAMRPVPAPRPLTPVPLSIQPLLSGMGSVGARLQGRRDDALARFNVPGIPSVGARLQGRRDDTSGPEDERKGPRFGPK